MTRLTSLTPRTGRIIVFGVALTGLTACENLTDIRDKVGEVFARDPAATSPTSGSLELVERDIEAPSVFDVTDRAIWDGRPSFGGVWAAYPGNIQPERVRILNLDNNKSVVGALFRREADNPGPPIELSSDAAAALGVTPGLAQNIRITALRREPVEVPPEEPVRAATPVATTDVISEVPLDGVETTSVTSVTGSAATRVVSDTATAVAAAKPRPNTVAPAVATTSTLDNPFIQVGTFASSANAAGLRSILSKNGVPAQVRQLGTNSGKLLYRVLAGPAATEADFKEMSTRVSSLGFTDAFPVDK